MRVWKPISPRKWWRRKKRKNQQTFSQKWKMSKNYFLSFWAKLNSSDAFLNMKIFQWKIAEKKSFKIFSSHFFQFFLFERKSWGEDFSRQNFQWFFSPKIIFLLKSFLNLSQLLLHFFSLLKKTQEKSEKSKLIISLIFWFQIRSEKDSSIWDSDLNERTCMSCEDLIFPNTKILQCPQKRFFSSTHALTVSKEGKNSKFLGVNFFFAIHKPLIYQILSLFLSIQLFLLFIVFL